jgi:hypothetical protein
VLAPVSKLPACKPRQTKRNKISKIPIANAIIFRKTIVARNFLACLISKMRQNRQKKRGGNRPVSCRLHIHYAGLVRRYQTYLINCVGVRVYRHA